MMKNGYLIMFLILSIFVVSCKTRGDVKSADEAYRMYQFSIAADMYGALYKKVKNPQEKARVAFMAAESYTKMSKYDKASVWYKKAIEAGFNKPIVHYKNGQSLKKEGKYSEAKSAFKTYIKEDPREEKKGNMQIEMCDKASKWKQKNTDYIIDNFKIANSKYNDFCPMFYKDEGTIYLTSDREGGINNKTFDWTGGGYSDLYYIEREKVKKGKPARYKAPQIPVGLNTKLNDGIITFDKKGRTAYFTQCNGEKGKLKNCRIMVATKKGKEWSSATPLPFCVEDSFANYGQPILSPDEKRLYFTSNRIGGYGEVSEDGKYQLTTDIYMASFVKRGRTWSTPVNLGETVNTPENEAFPYIYEDGTLYFASDGHPGIGGLDMFKSKGKGKEWEEPVNLQSPINSNADDFGILIKSGGNEQRGYAGFISSNRDPKRGDDIFTFMKPPVTLTLSGTIFDKKTGKPASGAVIKFKNITADSFVTITTTSNGRYSWTLDLNNLYSIEGKKEGYWDSKVEMVSTEGLKKTTNFVKNLEVAPIPPPEEEIVLENLYYDLAKAFIRPDAAKVLDDLIVMLNKYPTFVIELSSHTDCRATYKYNMDLSQRRADSAVSYLVRHGINPKRLEAKGYGESKLVNDCDCENGKGKGRNCTEEEHQANRRTVFRILRTDFKEEKTEDNQYEDEENNEYEND